MAYEILCFKFGHHPFNRFVWTIEPPATTADYASKKMIRMGQLASKIVEAALSRGASHGGEDNKQRGLLDAHLVRILHLWVIGYVAAPRWQYQDHRLFFSVPGRCPQPHQRFQD